MRSSISTRPRPADALVALAVLVLAAALALSFWRVSAAGNGALTVTVLADGQEIDRFPLTVGEERTYTSHGYTLRVETRWEEDAVGLRVAQADCPNQDCVHTGRITRGGQSVVCLPARLAIQLEGGASDGVDAVLG